MVLFIINVKEIIYVYLLIFLKKGVVFLHKQYRILDKIIAIKKLGTS